MFSGTNSAMRSGCRKASNTLSSGASILLVNATCQVSPVFCMVLVAISLAGHDAAFWIFWYW